MLAKTAPIIVTDKPKTTGNVGRKLVPSVAATVNRIVFEPPMLLIASLA
jgi:hypothetical protein